MLTPRIECVVSVLLALTFSTEALLPKAIRLNEQDARMMKNLPEDMAFFIADIKYTGQSLKIVEFGEGGRSRFKGHSALFGQGSI